MKIDLGFVRRSICGAIETDRAKFVGAVRMIPDLSSEERLRSLARRAGYRTPEALAAAIKESRKAMRAAEMSTFSAAGNGAQGEPATTGFGEFPAHATAPGVFSEAAGQLRRERFWSKLLELFRIWRRCHQIKKLGWLSKLRRLEVIGNAVLSQIAFEILWQEVAT